MSLKFALPYNSVTIGEKIVKYDNKGYIISLNLITFSAENEPNKVNTVFKPRNCKYVFSLGFIRIGFAYYFVVTMTTEFNRLSQFSVKFISIE